MKTRFYFLVFAIGVCFAACQKEFSKENNGTPQNGTSDSTVLKAYVLLDTSSGSADTFNITTFAYDNLKRLTKEITINYTNNIPDLTNSYSATSYFYTGSDLFPAKTIVLSLDSSGNNQLTVDSVVSYFTRNASQQITRDSSYYIQFYRSQGPAQGLVYITTSNFSLFADSVIENYVYEDSYGIITGKNKYAQTKSNGNLSKEILSIWENGVYRTIRSADYIYDAKINPFTIRSTNYPVTLKNDFGTRDYILKNNPITETYTEFTSSPPTGYTSNYNYTYNTLGYPKTVTEQNTAIPNLALKGIYIYTK